MKDLRLDFEEGDLPVHTAKLKKVNIKCNVEEKYIVIPHLAPTKFFKEISNI